MERASERGSEAGSEGVRERGRERETDRQRQSNEAWGSEGGRGIGHLSKLPRRR